MRSGQDSNSDLRGGGGGGGASVLLLLHRGPPLWHKDYNTINLSHTCSKLGSLVIGLLKVVGGLFVLWEYFGDPLFLSVSKCAICEPDMLGLCMTLYSFSGFSIGVGGESKCGVLPLCSTRCSCISGCLPWLYRGLFT